MSSDLKACSVAFEGKLGILQQMCEKDGSDKVINLRDEVKCNQLA